MQLGKLFTPFVWFAAWYVKMTLAGKTTFNLTVCVLSVFAAIATAKLVELPPDIAAKQATRVVYIQNGLPAGTYIVTTNTPLGNVLPSAPQDVREFVKQYRATNETLEAKEKTGND